MVNKAELRQFIMQSFSDLELDELCFDYYPDLLNEFTAGMTKSQKVIALIGYCERRGLADHLLGTLSKLRPVAYREQFGLAPAARPADRPAGRDPNRIFLSHANQDADFTRRLAGDLRRDGFDIWMAPESIEPGEKWVDAVERGLDSSGIFLLVITPHAANSKWVRDESNYAIALQNKNEIRLFTLLVGEGWMPPMWSVRQHISFREGYDEGLRRLLDALRPASATGPPAPTPAATPPTSRITATAPVTSPTTTRPAAPPPAYLGRKPDPTSGKSRRWLWVALVLVAAFAGWRLLAGGPGDGSRDSSVVVTPTGSAAAEGDEPTATPTRRVPTPAPTLNRHTIEVRTVALPDGRDVEQVLVPAGSFWMGSVGNHDDEEPWHAVVLDAFWLDRTEVTNAQYAACVAAGTCRAPQERSSLSREDYFDNPEYADYPVIWVGWADAHDYCAWAGGRLPTEAEWEYAAVGTQGFTFPWGQIQPTCELLNYDYLGSSDSLNCVGDTTGVGSYPRGASWVGALDMAGNALEWVNDWYDPGYYAHSPDNNPTGPASGEHHVLRGGAFNGWGGNVRSAFRGDSQLAGELEDGGFFNTGFRCAWE